MNINLPYSGRHHTHPSPLIEKPCPVHIRSTISNSKWKDSEVFENSHALDMDGISTFFKNFAISRS